MLKISNLLECAPRESKGSENLGLHSYGQESKKLVPLVLSELQGGKAKIQSQQKMFKV
jgi:hypothetical protein